MAITWTSVYTARRTVVLAAGDTAALMLFAAIGRGSHGEATGLGALGEVAGTATPFILGWLGAAPWLGAFKPAATDTPAGMLRATAMGWCAALVLGALLRALFIGRLSPPSFYVVTFLAALALLALWRGGFALWERRLLADQGR